MQITTLATRSLPIWLQWHDAKLEDQQQVEDNRHCDGGPLIGPCSCIGLA